MRIAQIVMPGASQFERKCRRIDAEALAAEHRVISASPSETTPAVADAAHVYATSPLPAAPFVGFSVPYLSSVPLERRWSLRKPTPPKRVVSPLAEETRQEDLVHLPEAVEEEYWSHRWKDGAARARAGKLVGSSARPAVRNMVEQTLSRMHRFREDVQWTTFDGPPPPEDLAELDAWVDPAVEESDFDGFVAEALVVGVPVIASRTPMNVRRLERGRTGMLVPPRDPNEMTHAILTALFKPEVADSRQQAARQTISKFQPRQRVRILIRLYETLTA